MPSSWVTNSDELYSALRTHLMERVRDKEFTIRVQAVVALSKLAGSEDPNELDDDEVSIIDTLTQIRRYDSAQSAGLADSMRDGEPQAA